MYIDIDSVWDIIAEDFVALDGYEEIQYAISLIWARISELPKVEIAPDVIRCCECRFEDIRYGEGFCKIWKHVVESECFCSAAERLRGDEE